MADTRAIAFYLPQFHPIRENDVWWGNGFTEWTNVVRSRPLFRGHAQPRLPGELGFYDLRLAEVRARQAALARNYGLHGFCYYYYWFNGRRLLERPLEEVVKSDQPDFPFCICWANENWTRRWDGAEDEILIEQVHNETSDARFIRDALPILQDPRYIRVDGAPLLLVYRPDLMHEPRRATDIWRAEARAAGIQALHLCAVQSFGMTDPRPIGFDAAVEFPPHGVVARDIRHELPQLSPAFEGKVYDYRDVVDAALVQRPPAYRRYRGVMTSWDNTARRGLKAHVFDNSTPREYEIWLRAIVAENDATLPPGQRLVFINAWNEWAEGAYLEPDQQHGYAYLEATARALRQRSDWRAVIETLRRQADVVPERLRQYAADLEFTLEAQSRALGHLQTLGGLVERLTHERQVAVFSPRIPLLLRGRDTANSGRMHVDHVRGVRTRDTIVLHRDDGNHIDGWAFGPGIDTSTPDAAAYLTLTSMADHTTYYAPLLHRSRRYDVETAHTDVEARCTIDCGFSAMLSCERCAPGEYRLGVVHVTDDRVVTADWQASVIIE